jgi:hypothetical protein
MEVARECARSESNHIGHYERQVAFCAWITDLFRRAAMQQIALEPLTDFELEWIGRM